MLKGCRCLIHRRRTRGTMCIPDADASADGVLNLLWVSWVRVKQIHILN